MKDLDDSWGPFGVFKGLSASLASAPADNSTVDSSTVGSALRDTMAQRAVEWPPLSLWRSWNENETLSESSSMIVRHEGVMA